MTTYSNLSGTTYPSYQIGKNGVKLNQGPYTPSSNPSDPTYVAANNGDMFFNTSSSPARFVFQNNQWVKISDWVFNGNTTVIDGPIGIGTNTVQSGNAIAINGNIEILNSGSIYFSDGSKQTSAASFAAGSTGSIQFNDGTGHFDADAGIFWDNTNKRLNIDGTSPSTYTTIQFKHVGMEAIVSEIPSGINSTVIDTVDATVFRSGHYYIQITDIDNNYYQISQLSVLQNGNIAIASEYNLMFDNQIIGTFDAELQGSNLQITYTPSYSSNVVIKTNRNTMTL